MDADDSIESSYASARMSFSRWYKSIRQENHARSKFGQLLIRQWFKWTLRCIANELNMLLVDLITLWHIALIWQIRINTLSIFRRVVSPLAPRIRGVIGNVFGIGPKDNWPRSLAFRMSWCFWLDVYWSGLCCVVQALSILLQIGRGHNTSLDTVFPDCIFSDIRMSSLQIEFSMLNIVPDFMNAFSLPRIIYWSVNSDSYVKYCIEWTYWHNNAQLPQLFVCCFARLHT